MTTIFYKNACIDVRVWVYTEKNSGNSPQMLKLIFFWVLRFHGIIFVYLFAFSNFLTMNVYIGQKTKGFVFPLLNVYLRVIENRIWSGSFSRLNRIWGSSPFDTGVVFVCVC